jgi:hypothetical protein
MHCGSVKLIICQQDPESTQHKTSAAKITSAGIAEPGNEFHVSRELRRRSSPVFASMLDGPWKESAEQTITIDSFSVVAFKEFLNCLLIIDNETACAGDPFKPNVIRKVLPIASCYQIDALKNKIISTVKKLVEDCKTKPVTDHNFKVAADSLFAVEASLPESEVPDWPEATLRQLFMLMVDFEFSDDRGFAHGYITSDIKVSATIFYKPNGGLTDLSKKTLMKCVESISVRATYPLKGARNGELTQNVTWPSFHANSAKLEYHFGR